MADAQDRWVEFKCLEVTQPIGTFYIGAMKSREIVRLSYADVRRIEGERREVETYLGIERPLSRKRVAELKEYVSTVDASFPSSVIVAIQSVDDQGNANVRYDRVQGLLAVRDREDIAKILDGQHRIAGLQDYQGEGFEVIVTIFVDMDIEDQAMVFATINLEQTKVNKSLAYDLYEYTKRPSPQKTAHNIVRLLDAKEGSSLRGKIKILGAAEDPGESVSQALFIDALLPMISREPRKDRELLKRGKKPARASPGEEQSLIFRDMFLDEKDAEIARVLWNYFGAVEDRWGDYWRVLRKGYVLNRTTGFRGLMLFLPSAYLQVAKLGEVPSRERFGEVFRRIRLEGHEITPDNFPPGTSGQTRLRDTLRAQAGLS